MPELPEVETTVNELKLILVSKNIDKILVNVSSLRKPLKKDKIKSLEGCKVIRVSRRGKYIQIFFNNNYILLIHLGMSGRLILKKKPFIFYKHDHVVLILERNFCIVLNDPRRFGLVEVIYYKNLYKNNHFKYLGVEPLTSNFSSQYLRKILYRKKTNIKSLLLNQKLIAGLGNIYTCESLYESSISPLKIASSLSKRQISVLCAKIKKVLKHAINSKGSSINNYKSPMGILGKFQNKFKVYNREGKSCRNRNCKEKITRIIISGRSSYYCKNCQKV